RRRAIRRARLEGRRRDFSWMGRRYTRISEGGRRRAVVSLVRLARGAEPAGELPERLEDTEQDVEAEEPDEDEGRLKLGRDEGARADREGDEEHRTSIELQILERAEADGRDHQAREEQRDAEDGPSVLGSADGAGDRVVRDHDRDEDA